MPTRFETNVEAVIGGANLIGQFGPNLVGKLARDVVRGILTETFIVGMRVANSDDGFPEEFQSHLLNIVKTMPINVIVDYDSLFVSVDFGYLGDETDLRKAYHQGARLQGGGQLWGPYTGQPLASEDDERRHIFWEAVRREDSSVEMPGRSGKVKIPAGAWERTKEQYIRIWGNKAPQWLLIQYGQEEWPPYVIEYDLINKFYADMVSDLTALLAVELQYTVELSNLYRTAGVSTGFTSKGQPRLLGKTTIINGKAYKPGRFIPKNPKNIG